MALSNRPAQARTAKTRPAYAIESVDHALRLAAMLQVEDTMTVSEAAARLGVARSTAHRVLAMLVYRDFAVQTPDRHYRSGPILELAAHTNSLAARLRAVGIPHLDGLVAILDESANLMLRTGNRVRFIASAESGRALRVDRREGMVFPAHLVSGGLVLLAEFDDAALIELYAHDPGSGVDLGWLRSELRKVRTRGYALNRETSEKGVTAVGRVVRNPRGEAVAAVSVSMPSARYTATDLPRITGALAFAARAIEADLAASSDPASSTV